jgi:catechol 2,3-dioxygenase-like lactoylglutathione lyase family enzyme
MAVIRYLVRDVDAALAFYVDTLGLALIKRWGPPFTMVERGDLTLWLSGPGSSASRALADGSVPAPGGWNRLVIETDDLAALADRLRAASVHFRSELVAGPGGKHMLVEDPSGNPIELFESGDA